MSLAREADARRIPTVLDAGSVHLGTEKLIREVDYLVVSEKFAYQYTSKRNAEQALRALQRITDTVIITLGDKGLIWGRGGEHGSVAAMPVRVIDTNGAGDAFHGAFCAGLSQGMEWQDILIYATAAAAGCCTQLGRAANSGTGDGHDEKISIRLIRKNSILLSFPLNC